MKYTVWLTPRQLTYLSDKSLKLNVTRVDEDLINDNRVIFSGSKNNFYAERFYVNTTGATLDANITIKGQKPTLDLVTNSTFITGTSLTGY